jgi:dolichol-phosphate mannosyltransferase
MDLTVIVPTFNEAPNIAELVERIYAATIGIETEILFVDDSTDGTAGEIERVSVVSPLPLRLIHRAVPAGGLSGAVLEGLAASDASWALVMDGDLQHPPEMIPVLLAAAIDARADLVVASRYVSHGSASGLAGHVRHVVSAAATMVTRAVFPFRLRDCTDPMTGFFALRRGAVDLAVLKPRGFKILLEIMARTSLSIVEVPFVFGQRKAGESKASIRNGLQFILQIVALRSSTAFAFGERSGHSRTAIAVPSKNN